MRSPRFTSPNPGNAGRLFPLRFPVHTGANAVVAGHQYSHAHSSLHTNCDAPTHTPTATPSATPHAQTPLP